MRKTVLIASIIIFSGLSTATIATYTGETVKQGPGTSFMIGVASDQKLDIEVEVEEVQGLKFSYNGSMVFRPGDSDKVVQRGNQLYSLKEIYIDVESVNISKERYEIPVTLRAFNDEQSRGTRPQVIHERDYSFEYVTDLSSDFGFDGSLIDREESQEEINEPDETLNITEDGEENTLTDGNTTDSQGEENRSGPGMTTYLLMAGIVVLTLYIVREAFT